MSSIATTPKKNVARAFGMSLVIDDDIAHAGNPFDGAVRQCRTSATTAAIVVGRSLRGPDGAEGTVGFGTTNAGNTTVYKMQLGWMF